MCEEEVSLISRIILIVYNIRAKFFCVCFSFIY
ncbi:Uncharacterised protein [Serratia quinivorans]|nr:Uncharacterised protein [Serratia quinivorans]